MPTQGTSPAMIGQAPRAATWVTSARIWQPAFTVPDLWHAESDKAGITCNAIAQKLPHKSGVVRQRCEELPSDVTAAWISNDWLPRQEAILRNLDRGIGQLHFGSNALRSRGVSFCLYSYRCHQRRSMLNLGPIVGLPTG